MKKIVITIVVVVFAIFFLKAEFELAQKKEFFPRNGEILFVYSDGAVGNGDYVFAQKGKATKEEFLKFVKKLGLSNSKQNEFEVIGFIPAQSDVPAKFKDWDEPKNPETKFYKMAGKSFVRCVYHNGVVYYYSRGW